jgi:predicted alpha/beta-fold hydrolase
MESVRQKAIIVFLPGINTTVREPYIRNIISDSLRRGYQAVLFNNRWDGETLTVLYPRIHAEIPAVEKRSTSKTMG